MLAYDARTLLTKHRAGGRDMWIGDRTSPLGDRFIETAGTEDLATHVPRIAIIGTLRRTSSHACGSHYYHIFVRRTLWGLTAYAKMIR